MSWSDAEAQSHRDIQEEFGETFVARPQHVKPNYPAAVDPSRAILYLPGIFVWTAKMIGVGLEVKVSSRDPQFTFLHCDLPYAVRRGDMMQRCKDASLFEVTSVERDGESGVLLCLIQLGAQS